MGRTPKNYSGTQPTGRELKQLLPTAFCRIKDRYGDHPDLIVQAWPKIIGEKLTPMTRAVSFDAGVLTVHVDNSTLYSVLSQQERIRLLERLRMEFPKITIRNIVFRIGK